MSAPSDPKSPTPESPTTARPLEMDDDDYNEPNLNGDEPASKTAASATSAAAVAGTGGEPAPPPKPPRPLTEQQKNEQTLKDAFPTVDPPVIKAVLTASRGNIEAAFHALLQMTDPDATEPEADEQPPPLPQAPRPVLEPLSSAAYGRLSPNSQLAADEEYARQLAQQYETEGAYESRTSSHGPRTSSRSRDGPVYPPRSRQETGLKPNELWGDREHSFVDDDLPVIRENLRKGFQETQAKFNSWFTDIKKRIDDEFNTANDDSDEEQPRPSQSQNPNRFQNQGRPGPGGPGAGRGRGGMGNTGFRQPTRRSGDYDADPELLTDDFAGIQLHADGTPVRNPNVFRPPPPSGSPRPGSDRKVAFRESDEVIDMYNASPKVKDASGGAGASAAGAKPSKWQPLSTVDPTPIADDPFSLGDSEDEKEHTKTPATSKTDKPGAEGSPKASAEDEERLRKAAAEAMADSLVGDKSKP